MLTITDLNIRADEHVRRTHDADRYGWMRADARDARMAKIRVGLGALAALGRRRPATRGAGIPTVGSVPASGTAPRVAA